MRLSPIALGVLLAAACSSSPPPDEKPKTETSAIINGNADTTHQAVVAISLQSTTEGGICSGTIIKTDPATHIGWVLTAAHCVDDLAPNYVLQGDDFSKSSLVYDVVDFAADPSHVKGDVSSTKDFGVIRIIGVDATTPTIDLAGATDGLAVGSAVESVGFGKTTPATDMTDDNTIRHSLDKNISALSAATITYNQSTSGICLGDSGGPVLAMVGGVQKVAGVHSYVTNECTGTGVSGRVSFDLTWINSQLAKAPPTETCTTCAQIANDGNGPCSQLSKKCLADTDCNAYYQCLSNKTMSPADCATAHPKGVGPFNAQSQCVCNQQCQTLCTNTSSCRGQPKCGFDLPAGDCQTCNQASCCNETIACAADSTCYGCLVGNDADPECATNALRKTLSDCAASKCATQCALDPGFGDDPGAGGDDGGAAAGGGTTTTTKSGCATAPGLPGDGGAGLFALALAIAAVRSSRSGSRSRSARRD